MNPFQNLGKVFWKKEWYDGRWSISPTVKISKKTLQRFVNECPILEAS